MAWTLAQMPDQHGRRVVVTGANSGIGFETALALARAGAEVVLACRSPERGAAAVERIRAAVPEARLELRLLDLGDLDSVRRFAEDLPGERLDLLINNAGVMIPPLGRTRQGFEIQLGTNHLGHFALTGLLLPRLTPTPGARVVVVSSAVHHGGSIDLSDPHYERRRYIAFAAYAQSKLANLLFALELQRRLEAAGSGLRVTAAHPGYTATELQRDMTLGWLSNLLFAMKAPDGALPTLRAATDPEAGPGSYWGPRWLEVWGPPVAAWINPKARDPAVAAALWSWSEAATGLRYPG